MYFLVLDILLFSLFNFVTYGCALDLDILATVMTVQASTPTSSKSTTSSSTAQFKTSNSSTLSTMTPSSAASVDLLYLTFNCGKSILDVPVFSAHLKTAFRQNATDLPQVVVL
ncbi:hypothetical protein KAF25_008202 [Fusarium avenaceum]|uniref:Uncharacterized protein n=1 Tax=Fusarium avenaceum TaxID=40199 RepID=A0A9P7KW03_9HYPO|nr:hypothetical protein KAF25_008202 [Fusarium avenaceum]